MKSKSSSDKASAALNNAKKERGSVSKGSERSIHKWPANYWAEKGRKIITERYATISGIADMCSILGISPSHFREAFYFAYDITPKAYLDAVRIDEAKRLLLGSGEEHSDKAPSISHVAKSVGFRNLLSFRRSFRRITGISPSEFEKQHRRCSLSRENALRK